MHVPINVPMFFLHSDLPRFLVFPQLNTVLSDAMNLLNNLLVVDLNYDIV